MSAVAPPEPVDQRGPLRRVWTGPGGDIATALLAGLASLAIAAIAWKVTPADLALRWAFGGGDQVLHYGIFQSATQVFPFLPNPAFGFPEAQNLFFAPLLDLWSAIFVWVCSWFTTSGILVLNLYMLGSFVAVGLTSYAFFRALGLRRLGSALWAVAFATLPHHFLQLTMGHPFIANYWAVPLIGILVLLVLGREQTAIERWIAAAPRPSGLRRRVAIIIALALLVGLTQSYYFVFGAILVGGAWLFRTLGVLATDHRRWRQLAGPTATVGALAMVIVTQLAILSIDWGDRYEKYFAGRLPGESELYGGKIALLLLPWEGSGVPGLWRMATAYLSSTMVATTSEGPFSSIVAALSVALALVALLAALGIGWIGHRPRSSVARAWFTDAHTSALLFGFVWSLLFFTLGALGIVFAIWVSPEIRAWSRISILVYLFAMGAMALLADRVVRTRLPRLVAAGVLVVLIIVDHGLGVFRYTELAANRDEEVRTVVSELESEVDAGCGIVQLPIQEFPEAGTVGAMGDYDQFLPALYATTDLRFSYGAVRGTLAGDYWGQRTTDAEVAAGILESGACAVLVDTAAYVEDDGGWERVLEATGVDTTPTIESSKGRWLVFVVDPQTR